MKTSSLAASGFCLVLWASFQWSNACHAAETVAGGDSSPAIDEVVVTAEKRTERLQDVPVPVTAISAEGLVNNNQLLLQDYYSQVPSLTLTPGNQSAQVLTIRGISPLGGNPTVGIAIDGVPYGSSTALGAASAVPDIDPGDLERIEVLRGPQGTLYGTSSEGGLINFVTVDPSFDRLSGRVQAGTSFVDNGAEPGYAFRGSVNIPLGNTLAVRASGFVRQDPGYVDNPSYDLRGVNEAHAWGGRLAALWRPSDLFSIKLSALYQEIKGDGVNDIDDSNYPGYVGPVLSKYEQINLPGSGAYVRKAQAYSATITAKIGNGELTALTGFNVNSFRDGFDYTSALGGLTESGNPPSVPGFGVTGTPVVEHTHTNKFTQEIRYTLPLTQRIDWLAGLFYTYENSPYVQDVFAEDATSGKLVGELISFNQPTTYAETAEFTDFTFRITDSFDVQLGARESQVRQVFQETDTGAYVPLFDGVPASPNIFPREHASTNAFTYLFTPRLHVSEALMVYARLASGYRAGGGNQPAAGGSAQYSPDKTENYELGLKGDFLNHLVSVDTSLYYIDWRNIQLGAFNPNNGEAFTVNGGRAKSQGIEFSSDIRPTKGLKISSWVAFNEAVLKGNQPTDLTITAAPGDRLPFNSRFSANFAIQQDFPLWAGASGFVGSNVSYVGEREGNFAGAGTTDRQSYPAYARTDAHAGIAFNTWTLNLFVNNVTNRRGVLNGGLTYFPQYAFLYIQPITGGLSIVKTF